MTTTESKPLTWDLESLGPGPETGEFQDLLERFTQDLVALADRSDALPAFGSSSTVAEWTRFLAEHERVYSLYGDLYAFVGCHAAADANNKLLQQLEGRLAALHPFKQRIETNLEFALEDTTDEAFERLVNADPELAAVRFFLEECRRNVRLRLPKEQEALAAALGVDGIHAWGRLYDRVSADLRVELMERGELVKKSPGQVRYDSPERSVRENNFFAADRAWNSIADTCADALNHIAGTRLTLYRHLGLRDHLEVPLRLNRMRRETLEAMWFAITERKAALVGYLEAKARLLGLDRLAWYDLQAPLPGGEATITYDKACDTVIETFQGFSPELGSFARDAIAARWVEAEDRAGKRQGGFCTDFPTKKETRIFMTFTGSPDGMSTLAHELGHAYHAWVVKDRPLVLRDYPANLAETASTFAESVLGEQRLAAARSKQEELGILDNLLGDAVAFLMNIHARFLFEDEFHRARAREELTAARLSELMLAAQREAYLDHLAPDGWHPSFWISKLHFYISSFPFYNFPYAFGYLLSLGIWTLAGEDKESFPARYRSLLVATGSELTEDAVRTTFGCDLTQPEFWHRGLEVMERRVARFVELAG